MIDTVILTIPRGSYRLMPEAFTPNANILKMSGITDEMYDSLLKDYKEKQAEILDQMQDHSDADEQFYLTANMTLNIAKRAKEIFISSEVDEKRQFLGFLLQNCVLNEKKLEFTMRSPYNTILDLANQPTMLRG